MIVPFALSTQGWTAIAAVGGAVVGATAGGTVEWLIDSTRSKRLAKAGARLFAADIKHGDECLEDAEDGGEFMQYYEFADESWREYRTVLATHLDDAEFALVADAAGALQMLRRHTHSSEGTTDAKRFNEMTADLDIGAARKILTEGYNALSELAGHDPARGATVS